MSADKNSLENENQPSCLGAVMHRLKAVQTLKNNPDLLLLMAEFKRANFVGSYIMEHQIETEEELAAVWLSQLEARLFQSNGA